MHTKAAQPILIALDAEAMAPHVMTKQKFDFGSRDTMSEELIREELQQGIGIHPQEVVRIWKIGEGRDWVCKTFTIRIEKGGPRGGLEHMLRHDTQKPFANRGITGEAFLELIEAATKVGRFIQPQSKTHKRPRPIFALKFHGQPVAVAITIGPDGYVVGANFRSWTKLKEEVGKTDEDLAAWPNVPTSSARAEVANPNQELQGVVASPTTGESSR
ncbi:hypothetical protein BGZ57DRAFT_852962 [Hyaloscypha finlandica]|nr:hypothetical protein BGZ57DRAFT_852962 [Hyaloscypha finlandica]